MNTVKIRNLEIGTGAPKVIVPIVGKTREEILAKGKELASIPLHVVEWRVDFYEDVFQIPQVLETLKGLRAALGETPILFTFRTLFECCHFQFRKLELGFYGNRAGAETDVPE